MKKLYSFGLSNGMYGVLTQVEIEEMCVGYNTTVSKQVIATYDDALWSACCGCNIEDGYYTVAEGLIKASDDGIELIDLRIIC